MPKRITIEEYRQAQARLAEQLSAVLSGVDLAICAETLLNLWVGSARAMKITDAELREHLESALVASVAEVEHGRVS
jgi:hypothetical protein